MFPRHCVLPPAQARTLEWLSAWIKLVFASVAATRNQAEAFLRPSEEEEFVDIEQRGRGGGCVGPGCESVVDVDVDDVTGRR